MEGEDSKVDLAPDVAPAEEKLSAEEKLFKKGIMGIRQVQDDLRDREAVLAKTQEGRRLLKEVSCLWKSLRETGVSTHGVKLLYA